MTPDAVTPVQGQQAGKRRIDHGANAARLVEANPALLQLRTLEVVDTAGRAGGNTLVLGVPPHLVTKGGA